MTDYTNTVEQEWEAKLAEKVVQLLPEVMGMYRVPNAVVTSPKVVELLVALIEGYIEACQGWEAHCEVLVDQRDWNTGNNERLRDALYEIAHMDPIRRIQGDAQRVAKKALEVK